jgi:hypothetical protein
VDWAREVSIANCYGLGSLGIKSQLGVRFSALSQTSHGTNPASCTMGSVSLFWEYNRWGVKLTTDDYLAERLKEQQTYTSAPLVGLHALF